MTPSETRKSVLGSAAVPSSVWVAKDGSTVKIADMDDAYVMNALRCSMWAASLARAKNGVFYATCEGPDGDGASSALDMESETAFDAAWSDHTDPFFEVLKLEARRRGLAGSSDEELSALGADMDVKTRLIEMRLIRKAEAAALDAKIEQARTNIKMLRRERKRLTP